MCLCLCVLSGYSLLIPVVGNLTGNANRQRPLASTHAATQPANRQRGPVYRATRPATGPYIGNAARSATPSAPCPCRQRGPTRGTSLIGRQRGNAALARPARRTASRPYVGGYRRQPNLNNKRRNYKSRKEYKLNAIKQEKSVSPQLSRL